MKRIEAIIASQKVDAVNDALKKAGVGGADRALAQGHVAGASAAAAVGGAPVAPIRQATLRHQQRFAKTLDHYFPARRSAARQQ